MNEVKDNERPLFSIVYPTRDRPAFIEQALNFLQASSFQSFEVIVSDNYSSASESCRATVLASRLPNLVYLRPPHPMSLVENWNFAVDQAIGDYVLVLTDKMMVLPNSLEMLESVISQTHADIYTWLDDRFYPVKYPDYFGEGNYVRQFRTETLTPSFESYDAQKELRKKAKAKTARAKQPASHYNRGKICFGAYSRQLVEDIKNNYGSLFHNISPDYTSMILALSSGDSAVEVHMSGIVHLDTDLSNGGKNAINDHSALQFLAGLGQPETTMQNHLIPGLYASQHAWVGHDYRVLQRKFGLPYELDMANWVCHCMRDLKLPGRVWSSEVARRSQFECASAFILQMNFRQKARTRFLLAGANLLDFLLTTAPAKFLARSYRIARTRLVPQKNIASQKVLSDLLAAAR